MLEGGLDIGCLEFLTLGGVYDILFQRVLDSAYDDDNDEVFIDNTADMGGNNYQSNIDKFFGF